MINCSCLSRMLTLKQWTHQDSNWPEQSHDELDPPDCLVHLRRTDLRSASQHFHTLHFWVKGTEKKVVWERTRCYWSLRLHVQTAVRSSLNPLRVVWKASRLTFLAKPLQKPPQPSARESANISYIFCTANMYMCISAQCTLCFRVLRLLPAIRDLSR